MYSPICIPRRRHGITIMIIIIINLIVVVLIGFILLGMLQVEKTGTFLWPRKKADVKHLFGMESAQLPVLTSGEKVL